MPAPAPSYRRTPVSTSSRTNNVLPANAGIHVLPHQQRLSGLDPESRRANRRNAAIYLPSGSRHLQKRPPPAIIGSNHSDTKLVETVQNCAKLRRKKTHHPRHRLTGPGTVLPANAGIHVLPHQQRHSGLDPESIAPGEKQHGRSQTVFGFRPAPERRVRRRPDAGYIMRSIVEAGRQGQGATPDDDHQHLRRTAASP